MTYQPVIDRFLNTSGNGTYSVEGMVLKSSGWGSKGLIMVLFQAMWT